MVKSLFYRTKFMFVDKELSSALNIDNQEMQSRTFRDSISSFWSLISWEYPFNSLTVLVLLNLICLFGVKFGFMVLIAGGSFSLLLCIHDAWERYRLYGSGSNGVNYIEDLVAFYCKIRFIFYPLWEDIVHIFQTARVQFCVLLFAVACLLWLVIDLIFSRFWLLYMLVMVPFVGTGIYVHLLPERFKLYFVSSFATASKLLQTELSNKKTSDDLDDYVPETSEEVKFQLDKAYNSLVNNTDEEGFVPDDEMTSIDGVGLEDEVSSPAQIDPLAVLRALFSNVAVADDEMVNELPSNASRVNKDSDTDTDTTLSDFEMVDKDDLQFQ